MLKSELIRRISSQNPHFYQRDVEKIVDAMLDQIVGALAQGDRVELQGFGTFSAKLRKAWTARNPRTGVVVSIPQNASPFFKAAKEMQKRLNPEAARMDEQRERLRILSRNLRAPIGASRPAIARPGANRDFQERTRSGATIKQTTNNVAVTVWI